jgi:hypothetical protein
VATLSGVALNAALYAPIAFAQAEQTAPTAATGSSGLKQMLLMTGIVLVAGSVGVFAAMVNRLNRDRAAWEARRAEYMAWEQKQAQEDIIRAANAPAPTTAAASLRERRATPVAREAETLLNRSDGPLTREVVSVPTGAVAGSGAPSGKDTTPLPSAGFGAELAIVGGPDQGRRFTITKPVLTLGREDRDILFTDDSISRRHAVLRVHTAIEGAANVIPGDKMNSPELRFMLYDEDSLHGTRVNGEPVGKQGRSLINGDRISLGKGRTVLLFERLSAGSGIEGSSA